MISEFYQFFNNLDIDDKDTIMNDFDRIKNIIQINLKDDLRYINVFETLLQSEYGNSLPDYDNTYIKFEGSYNGNIFEQIIKINDGKARIK